MAQAQEIEAGHHEKVMQIIRESGIFNPKISMEEITSLTQKVAALRPVASKAGAVTAHGIDYFIHGNFCVVHAD